MGTRAYGQEAMETIAKRIKELRKEHDMTQKNLAEELDISPQVVSNYENLARIPHIELINKMADVFNVSVDYLTGKIDHTFNADDEVRKMLETDPELVEVWKNMRNREEMELMFKKTQELDDETIREILKIVQKIEQ